MKTVWISGASGGLGKAVARAFAGAGYLVIAGARSFQDGDTDEDGIHRIRLDVTEEESCAGFARKALMISPRVDILVCAAAVLVLGPCGRTGVSEYRHVMETNFLGTVRMVSQALPVMHRRKSGRIFLFSSINGLLGIPFQSAYTASKHAIEGYAECLSMEEKPFGVQVCLIEPGDHRGGSQHTRLHAVLEDESSPYAEACRKACAVIASDEAGGLMPDRLGNRVVRCAGRKRLPLRLRIAKPDQHLAVFLHDLLPGWLNNAVLEAYYGKDK